MFRLCGLKRNCKQIAYSCHGWYIFRIVAVTNDGWVCGCDIRHCLRFLFQPSTQMLGLS
jgi:hypothetical protein